MSKDVYVLTGGGPKVLFDSLPEALREMVRRNEPVRSTAALRQHLLNRFKPRCAVEYGHCALTVLPRESL